MKPSDERKLTFNLIQSSRKKGSGRSEPVSREYRAVMKREKTLGTDEVIAECVESCGLADSPTDVKRLFEIVLSSMIDHTLADGRSRTIDDFFTLRMDIAGNFSRPDAAFDPDKHAITLNLIPAKRLRKMVRTNWPVNERRRPIGKIDSVHSPDGEIGKLAYGQDIIIEGHDLRLADQDRVSLFITFKTDPFHTDQHTYEFGCDLKENTDTRLVVAFPTAPILKPENVIGQPGQVCRYEYNSRKKVKQCSHGHRADVVFTA